ncbi:hypothetical protein RRG08_025459 [Elysia crispata]|uniref:Uncharacterized protein n=1 Tax=Elysia crispata TaxID=231223 RepID=A0AAE0YCA5_9GAST|nr:hypothetical protein RRG08_025459 [Elysia crispata]
MILPLFRAPGLSVFRGGRRSRQHHGHEDTNHTTELLGPTEHQGGVPLHRHGYVFTARRNGARGISFVTPVPVKPTPEEGKTAKLNYKSGIIEEIHPFIIISLDLNLTDKKRRNEHKNKAPPEEGKSKSFRLSQVPKTPLDGTTEAGEGIGENHREQGQVNSEDAPAVPTCSQPKRLSLPGPYGLAHCRGETRCLTPTARVFFFEWQKLGPPDGQRSGSSPTLSQTSTLTSAQGEEKASTGAKPGRKDSAKKERKGGATGGAAAAKGGRKPIAAPPVKKLTKEEELTLLQKIVKEEWFPSGIPPILDLVKYFQLRQLSIAAKFLNRASDKLKKQLNGPSAIARKKAVWTMKQLGLAAKKDVISALLPGLLDAREGSREELISNLGELLSGPGGADGLFTLMSSLGIENKPLGTKDEQQAAIKAISEKLQAEAENLKGGSADTVKQRVEMWVSSLNLPSDGSNLLSRSSNSRALDSSGAPRGMSSGLDTEGSFEKSSRQSTRRSRRRSKGGGKKKGGKSKGKARRQSSSGQPGEDKDDTVSVDMSVQTDPRSEGVEDDDDLSLIKKRRGRWRRGGLSQFREGEDATDEEEAGEFDGDDEDDDGVYGDTDDDGERPRRGRRADKRGDDEGVEEGRTSGTFMRIDYDLTPGMFRSETGGSEWSDDMPPLSNTTPGRPKGASVHKFYARRDHVATVEQDPTRAGGQFPTMPSIQEPNGRSKDRKDLLDPSDRDSDLHSESNYTEISKAFTTRDGISIGDSGIGKDMSETSSHAYGGSDSLYEQGRPRLSPIKSQTKLNAEGKKEPDWKDFFESEKVQEKRKTVGFSRKDAVQEAQIYDQSGRIAVLPPIMYVDPEHPTLPGEAGLRLLHSIRWADKEKTLDGGGRLVQALPGRLTITTHDESVGDTTYGFLQMHWTTQIPAVDQRGFHSERTAHGNMRQASELYGDGPSDGAHGFISHRGAEQQQVIDRTNLPRLSQRAVTMIKKNGHQPEKQGTKKGKYSASFAKWRVANFESGRNQWRLPPKRVSLCEAGAPGPTGPTPSTLLQTQYKCRKLVIRGKTWSLNLGFIWSWMMGPPKSIQLPKMIKGSIGREHSILNTSLDSDVLSVLAHSSVSLMPTMSLEKLMKTIKMAPPPSL